MDTSTHDMPSLFCQLGLPSQPDAIARFIADHPVHEVDRLLYDAAFWTSAQSDFLRQAIEEDSDWCEVVDELDSRLRC